MSPKAEERRGSGMESNTGRSKEDQPDQRILNIVLWALLTLLAALLVMALILILRRRKRKGFIVMKRMGTG